MSCGGFHCKAIQHTQMPLLTISSQCLTVFQLPMLPFHLNWGLSYPGFKKPSFHLKYHEFSETNNKTPTNQTQPIKNLHCVLPVFLLLGDYICSSSYKNPVFLPGIIVLIWSQLQNLFILPFLLEAGMSQGRIWLFCSHRVASVDRLVCLAECSY